MKMTNQTRSIIVAILCLSVVVVLTAAANDPGHDTLYIEEQGDSSLNGTLTINYNLSIVNTTFQGAGLNLYGNGYNSAPTQSYVSGTNAGDMYIDTASNLYLKYNGGSKVYIGFLARTDLNVSGALYVEGLNYSAGLVCLANGSNCPASLGGANISGNGAAAGYLAQWQNASILNNSIIYQSGNSIGIGYISPTVTLDVNGTINATNILINGTPINGETYTADNYTLTLTGTTFTLNTTYTNATYIPKSLGNCSAGSAISGFGSDSIICSGVNGTSGGGNLSAQGATAGTIPQFQNESTLNNSIIYQSGTNIGIGTSIPLAQLHLNSTSNQLRISYDDTNYGNISVNSAGNMTIKATGHVIIDLS